MLKKDHLPASPATKPFSAGTAPEWLEAIGDFPDHYHGHTWSKTVVPNNYLFFLRTNEEQFRPNGVTQNLHRRYELVINYSGEGYVCLGEAIYKFAPGQAFLVSPGTFHHYYGVAAPDFRWLFFTFELDAGSRLAQRADCPCELGHAELALADTAAQHYLNPRWDLEIFEAALHMGRIVQRMGKLRGAAPIRDLPSRERERCDLLRRITHFVDRHMDASIRIEHIADHIGVSGSNLRKLFREGFGVSLGSYLRSSRLTRGLQLISRDDLSVSDVARQCGFESVFSFSQSFRRSMGLSPTAYREHLSSGGKPLRIPYE